MQYPGILMGDTPDAMREDAVKRILIPMAEEAFNARSEINSIVLAVAQYWNDEADDAVHASVHYSRRHTPIWPHECAAVDEQSQAQRADFCRWCGGRVPGHPSNPEWVPWDDNGSAIEAFEAYCREACHQEMSTGEAYLPYAVVRRGRGVELVGKPVRSWADLGSAIDRPAPEGELAELLGAVYAAPYEDGPRSVLADWLLERSDPIGELIALQLKKKNGQTVRELIAEHGRSWIGRIDPVLAKSGAVFRRGFLEEAEVFFEGTDEIERYGSDPSWGTVEQIHFLPGGAQHLDPAMRALRTVSGLGRNALMQAALAKHAWPIRDLSTDVEDHFEELMESTAFPELKRLEVGSGSLRQLIDLLRSPLGAKLERIAVRAEIDQLPMILENVERFTSMPAFELTQRMDAGRPAGWSLIFEREGDRRFSTLRARLDNLGGDGRIERITEVIERLPRDSLVRVVLERTDLFEPMVEDEVLLREACRSMTRFHDVELA